MSKAIVSLETLDALFNRAHTVARRVDAGDTLPEADYHLNFTDAEQLFSELTPQR
jgi:predicted transcriptional regulator